MKKLITNYSFNKTLKQITFTDYTSVSLESVLLITNVTSNIVIYNFAIPNLGGTVSGNVLTLDYDTSSMLDTDDLQIWYEDLSVSPATESNQLELINLTEAVYAVLDQLSFLSNTQGFIGDIRVSVVNAPTVTTSSSSVISNIANFGGEVARPLMYSQMNQTSILSNVNNCIVS